MTAKEATKWINMLCDAKVGDVVTYKDVSIRVQSGGKCEDCAFHNNGEGHYCHLMKGEGVIPCSPFNNSVGKHLGFVPILLTALNR